MVVVQVVVIDWYVCITGTETTVRDKSILLLFSPIFLSGNSFFFPIMLKMLLAVSIFCSKSSYIAS